MNDIYARRLAQSAIFQSTSRALPSIYRATKITGEKLSGALIREEFMRINGHRSMPLLIPDCAAVRQQNSHWVSLHDSCAWAVSGRAFCVRNQTQFSQHAAAIGRLEVSVPHVRQAATMQIMTLEHVARSDGIATQSEEDVEDEAQATDAAADQ
jgi:hypothetical protein